MTTALALRTQPVKAGVPNTLRFTVKNAGNANVTTPFHYAVRLSRDAKYSPKSDALVAGTRLDFSPTQRLDAGQSLTFETKLRVPTCVDTVDYSFFFDVDSRRALVEHLETNNVARLVQRIERYPGAKPVLEFTDANGQRVAWTGAIFGPSGIRTARICTTSRPNAGNWALLVWSLDATTPKPDAAFQVAIGGLNSPIFGNWLGRIPASGHFDSSFDWRAFPRRFQVVVYAHALVFRRDFGAFLGTGGGLEFDL